MALRKKGFVFLKGILMGAADVVPGVSGGTIAFITGIYEELIKTIDNLDVGIFPDFKNLGWVATSVKYNLGFLLALFTGIALSILSLAKLITYLLETHTLLVWGFFFGLVLASILYIGKQITRWSIWVLLAIILGTVISYAITIAEPLGSPDSWWYLIFSGFIAIIAMILPGVSGAFLLLLLGSYQTVLNSLTDFVENLLNGLWREALSNLGNLALVAIGAILGLKVFSKALTWLFENKKNLTLALLTGFMIGSLNKLWPWKETISTRLNSEGLEVPFLEKSIMPSNYYGDTQLLAVIALVIIGFLLILILERWAVKKPN
jgi:putative membrane protein